MNPLKIAIKRDIKPVSNRNSQRLRQQQQTEAITSIRKTLRANSDQGYRITLQKNTQRTVEQNRTAHGWYAQIAKTTGSDPASVKAFCKLQFGIPIVYANNTRFKRSWQLVRQNFTEPQRLQLMQYPFNMPVTSLMTAAQHDEYTHLMQRHYALYGIELKTTNT